VLRLARYCDTFGALRPLKLDISGVATGGAECDADWRSNLRLRLESVK
jgi:hypothetical protein